jgi:hypothetical protein
MNEQDAKDLISRILQESPFVRYVAIYQDGLLVSHQREAVTGASHSESDRYEELLVNPTLLKLAKQRGDIDCGGLRFLVVGYGNFYQLVREFGQGHISVCAELEADPITQLRLVESILGTLPSRTGGQQE